MTHTRRLHEGKLPGRFDDLARLFTPCAIMDAIHHENALEMIDRLMAIAHPTQGQSLYLETLVQLVQAYEAAHHAIDTSDLTGLECLKHLLHENDMNASDLARLLGIHVSMGSKILNGERALTVDHLKKLAGRFRVGVGMFMG